MLSLPRELLVDIVRYAGLFDQGELALAHIPAWWWVPRAQRLLATCKGLSWLRELEFVIADTAEEAVYATGVTGRRQGPWYDFTLVGGIMEFNGFAWHEGNKAMTQFRIYPSGRRRSYIIEGEVCFAPGRCCRKEAPCACRMCELLGSTERYLREFDPEVFAIARDPGFRPSWGFGAWIALCRIPTSSPEIALTREGLVTKHEEPPRP